jgi:murein DD-endopeptidase MepM/ murein hydrolase activator NlpD
MLFNAPVEIAEEVFRMFTMPLKNMKLRKKGLQSSYGASYGYVRKLNAALSQYEKFHQGWDLEAATGTPCYAISGGEITHFGHHLQFGWNIVLQFSASGQTEVSPVDPLWAFYAHLSGHLVSKGALVSTGQMIGFTGHSGNASASSPHLHFEIRNTPNPSPGLGGTGRINPATILGYKYLICS